MVNVRLQFGQCRRRHTWVAFLCGLELGVCVFLCKQYIHIMSIYCHMAIKKASGKHMRDCGKMLIQVSILIFLDRSTPVIFASG